MLRAAGPRATPAGLYQKFANYGRDLLWLCGGCGCEPLALCALLAQNSEIKINDIIKKNLL
jgi:hypothetical protein